MLKFNPNPIVVKDKGIPCRIIGLAYDVDEIDFSLEILDLDQSVIQRHDVTTESLISIDKSYGEVIFVYKDAEGVVLKEDRVDVSKDGNLLRVDKKINDVELVLENMVKQQMDFPSGTPTEVNNHTEMLKKATMDKNARLYVTSKIRNIVVGSNLAKPEDVEGIVYRLYSNLYGMGVLQELDDDITIGEIMVNASVFPHFHSDIYYIREGKKSKFDKEFRNLDELKNVFSRSVEFNKKELNSVENAVVEATRANKDRVNILIPEASENYILNIRKFSNFVPSPEMMHKSGTIDGRIDQLMEVFVKGKANIGIGGAMGTGKTTLINYLLTKTEPIERKVVIASVSETDVERVLKGHDVVIMNVDDDKGFTFGKLSRSALRTTASRIIIPESRGGEFKQVYEANLKTKGNMFTAHALDDESFLDMCVDMYLSSSDSANESSEYIKNKLAKSIDVVLIMRKVGDSIRIKGVSEILLDEKRNYAGMNPLIIWQFDPENPLVGRYVATGNKLSDSFKNKLNEQGVPMSQLKDL